VKSTDDDGEMNERKGKTLKINKSKGGWLVGWFILLIGA
jgi:hypothetical protein